MNPHYVHTAVLADQRRQAMLERAEAHRRARENIESVGVLRDGSTVRFRPIRAEDAAALADAFARLSPNSRWMRFLTDKRALSVEELRYLTDVDHRNHEAVVALDTAGNVVGVARYIRDKGDWRAAEVAVTVIDEWQRRGLGSALFGQLSRRAGRWGIARFVALVGTRNRAVHRMLRTLEAPVKLVDRDYDTVEYAITLPEPCVAGACR